MNLEDYVITKFINKVKANEKLCVVCNKYYPHVIKNLCSEHYTRLKSRWGKLKKKK